MFLTNGLLTGIPPCIHSGIFSPDILRITLAGEDENRYEKPHGLQKSFAVMSG